jgi:CheY-like chemotaxis protein
VRVYTAGTGEEILQIHRKELMDLIITPIDVPDTGFEQIAVAIRSDFMTRAVRLALVAPNNRTAIEACSRCKPDAVVLRPVFPAVLLARAQQLLGVDWRENYRVILTVSVTGSAGDSTFFCRSRDISASGLLIETDRVLAPGSRLTCSFSLPGAVRIQAVGEVVRIVENPASSSHQYGIKFMQIPAPEREYLESFMDDIALRRAS